MQTKHLCVVIHIWTKGEVGAPLNGFKPSSKFFYWPFQGGASFVDHLCYFCLVLLWFHARLFVDALWSPAVMSNCDAVTLPLVPWVRCGAWLYRFLIFALFLTKIRSKAVVLLLFIHCLLLRPIFVGVGVGCLVLFTLSLGHTRAYDHAATCVRPVTW